MHATAKITSLVACLLASTIAGELPSFGDDNPYRLYSLPKSVLDAEFASPNATGVYESWMGTALWAAPGFSSQSWRVSVAIKEGIPLESSLVTKLNKTQVITGARVSLSPPGAYPGHPMNQSTFIDKDNSTSVSLCLVAGFGDGTAPTAGSSASSGFAKCGGVDECQKDLGAALRSAQNTQSKNASQSNCYPHPTIPESCKRDLGWKSMLSTTTKVAMNHSELLSGGVMMEWASDPHDRGNLTDYRAAVRTTFGVYAYFVMHEKDKASGNRTKPLGTQFDGFMCAQASNITEGSQGAAPGLGANLVYAGFLALVTALMLVL